MVNYDEIFEALQEAVNNGDITEEFAESVNDLAYEKYVVEATYDKKKSSRNGIILSIAKIILSLTSISLTITTIISRLKKLKNENSNNNVKRNEISNINKVLINDITKNISRTTIKLDKICKEYEANNDKDALMQAYKIKNEYVKYSTNIKLKSKDAANNPDVLYDMLKNNKYVLSKYEAKMRNIKRNK